MKFMIVTQEWMSAHGILPIPSMRRSKDGTKIILHEDYFNAFAQGGDANPMTEGADLYAHNSQALNELLASDEWSGGDEDATAESPAYVQAAAVMNLMEATKADIGNYGLTDAQKAKVYRLFPTWDELLKKGVPLPVGTELQDGGELYRVIQAHTPQADWKPSEQHALYAYVSPHEGTEDDPIPYRHWMLLEAGKYYTEYGVLYKCTQSLGVGYDSDLSGLAAFVTVV